MSDDPAALLRLITLSTCSSLDNFVVGISLGVHGSAPPHRLNVIVAIANGFGAFASAGFGSVLGEIAPVIASFGAATIFFWLCYSELCGYFKSQPSPLSSLALKGVAWRLAIPMTLNNLAGGVAGGLAELNAFHLGLAAFLASFILMFSGHYIAQQCAFRISSSKTPDPRLFAGIAFALLALFQLYDIGSHFWQSGYIFTSSTPPKP